MNDKIYVIAETYDQANHWIKNDIQNRYPANTSLTLSHYVYVSSPDKLRGVRDPHGYFVGYWRERPDILEIVESLMRTSSKPSQSLRNIYNELKPY